MQKNRITKADTAKTDARKGNKQSQALKGENIGWGDSPVEQILYLQQTIGNRAVRKLVQSGIIRTKLRIGKAGDKCEQEADRTADLIMQTPESKNSNFRKRDARQNTGEAELIRLKGDKSESGVDASPAARGINGLRGGGQPFPESIRSYFEPRFGYGFGHVKIHTDDRAAYLAQSINARAFTLQGNIVFAKGQYAPATMPGKHLIAHELTHVIQQSGADRRDTIRRTPVDSDTERMSITPQYARELSDQELEAEIRALQAHLSSLTADELEFSKALSSNLRILTTEAAGRKLPAAAGAETSRDEQDGAVAGDEDVRILQQKFDVLLIQIRRQLADFDIGVVVKFLMLQKMQMVWIPHDQVEGRLIQLNTSIENLDKIIRISRLVPAQEIKNEQIRKGVHILSEAVNAALYLLLTENEDLGISLLADAEKNYMDIYTRVFLETVEKVRKELPSPDEAISKSAFVNGFAQGDYIVIPGLMKEWFIFSHQLKYLKEDMQKYAMVEELKTKPVEERMEFLKKEEKEINYHFHKARILSILYGGFVIGAAVSDAIISYWVQEWHDVAFLRSIQNIIIRPLVEVLENPDLSMERKIKRAAGELESARQRAKERLQEVEDYATRVNWFINIAATLLALNAMRLTMVAAGRIGFLRATPVTLETFTAADLSLKALGLEFLKGVGRMTLGSLAFTGTRLGVTGAWRHLSPKEIAAQAGMDWLVLASLSATHGLLGYRYGRIKNIPPAKLLGSTFAVLWTWAAGAKLAATEEDISLGVFIKTLYETGKQTFFDLAVIVLIQRFMAMPLINEPEEATAQEKLAITEYGYMRKTHRGIADEIKSWLKSERDLTELESIAKRAEKAAADRLSLFRRMVKTGVLDGELGTELIKMAEQDIQVLRNMGDAASLGITRTSDATFSYRGRTGNMDHFLRRLKSQKFIEDFELINDSVFEVYLPGNATFWYFPEGAAGNYSVQPDFAADSIKRAVPELPGEIQTRALQNLKAFPVTEVNGIVTALVPGESTWIISWLAESDTGIALRSENAVFKPPVIRTLIAKPEIRELVISEQASDIQIWYQSKFENYKGSRSFEDFINFLIEVRSNRGTLNIESVGEAQAYIDELTRLSPAHSYDPVAEANQMAIGSATSRKPYRDIGTYLVKKGYASGDFVKVVIDQESWVIQSINSKLTRAWRFPREGYPPDKIVDIPLELLILRNADSLAQSNPNQAGRIRQDVRPNYDKLSFLLRVRGMDLGDIPGLLQRFESGSTSVPPTGVISEERPALGPKRLVIRSIIGDPQTRANYETQFLRGALINLEGWERAHSQGPGFGAESQEGIRYAPRQVNQELQNRGVEQFIRDLYQEKPDDVDLILTTETFTHPGSLRLESITYHLEAEKGDMRRTLFEVSIEIENKTQNPAIKVSAEENFGFFAE